jgi:hypothetical protein
VVAIHITKMISFNGSFLSSFFSRPFNCEDSTNAGIPDLKYDLFNVKFILPTRQDLFISSVLVNESYMIAYVNEDFSDACIPHKYQITSDFNQNDVCFNIIFGEKVCGDSRDSIAITPGPLFRVNKEKCYIMVSGSYDFLGN